MRGACGRARVHRRAIVARALVIVAMVAFRVVAHMARRADVCVVLVTLGTRLRYTVGACAHVDGARVSCATESSLAGIAQVRTMLGARSGS